ncbi:Hypothetical predicted protein, partial [Pelobates cultripes]
YHPTLQAPDTAWGHNTESPDALPVLPEVPKDKTQDGAYHKPTYRDLEYLWSGDLAGDAAELWSTHTTPANTSMGRRNQKPTPGNAPEQRDIGAMLQR